MNLLLRKFSILTLSLLFGAAFAQEDIFDYTGGVQYYVVPPGAGSIQIEAAGAQGGNGSGSTGGLGATMIGTFSVTPGDVLTVVVGQAGTYQYNSGGGGGGTGVINPDGDPMIVAGGGGGGSSNSVSGGPGLVTENGGNSSGPGGTGGNGGQKGFRTGDCGWASGGGGFYGDGYGGSGVWDGGALPGTLGGTGAGKSWLSGGDGGSNGGCTFAYPNNGAWGCGGGGSGSHGGGGGGGYSGGGGGQYVDPTLAFRAGAGGGSFNDGTDQINTSGNRSGHGQVIITVLCSPVTVSVTDTELCLGESFTAEAISEGGGTITWDGGLENGVEFTPDEAGLFLFNGVSSDPDDCEVQIEILVNEYPTVLAGVSDATICLGDEVVFTGGGADTYDWDMGVVDGTPFEPLDLGTTTYTVIGYDEIGCEGTATVDVTVDPVPVVDATASESELCEGETLIFSISGDADSYEWDPDDIVVGVPYAPADGVETFTVVGYFDATGCSTEDEITITLNPTPFVTATAGDGIFCADEMVVLAAGGDADIYTWDPTDLEPGIGTHTYTVTGIYDGIEGCPATASVEVNVVGTPVVTASADHEAVCLGQSVTLSGGGASFYEWDPEYIMDGVPFTPESVGTFDYTVTGEDSFGCTSEATITVTVAEPMVLTYEMILPSDEDDGEIDLTVTGGVAPFTFDWSNDGTGDFDDDEDLTDVGSGAYTATVMGASGCTEEIVVYLRSQADITDVENNILKAYPNPTSDIINLEVEGSFEYFITDISGAVILSGVGNNKEQISLSKLADGTYFINVSTDGMPTLLKVLKQ